MYTCVLLHVYIYMYNYYTSSMKYVHVGLIPKNGILDTCIYMYMYMYMYIVV